MISNAGMARLTQWWHGLPWNGLFWLSVSSMFGSAGFFAVSSELEHRDRMHLEEGHDAQIADGGPAKVALVLNGDEIVVEDAKGHRSRLRMLGIHAFDPVVNEREITAY